MDVGFVRTNIALMVLSAVAVMVRFWSRFVERKGRFWWDDWTCLLAAVLGIAHSALGIVWTRHGFGHHVKNISPTDVALGRKYLFGSYWIFYLSIALIKFSALFLYGRIFALVDSRYRMALLIAHFVVASWMMAFLATVVIYCRPKNRLWESAVEGSCSDSYTWHLYSSSIDLALDLLVLLLPMPMVWQLKLSTAKKLTGVLAFFCGYLAVVPSLIRVALVVELGQKTWQAKTSNSIDEFIGAYAEAPIGVIGLCVPSWLALIRRTHSHGLRSMFTSRSYYRHCGDQIARLEAPRGPTSISSKVVLAEARHASLEGRELSSAHSLEDCETRSKVDFSEANSFSQKLGKDLEKDSTLDR